MTDRVRNIDQLNVEDREWLLFDLLEGNLSEEDEAATLEAVEADDELFALWEAMQQTVLTPEPIVFTRKSELMKDEAAPIIIMAWWQKPMRVAAAIAAFAILSFGAYQYLTSYDQSTIPGVYSSLEEVTHPETFPQQDVIPQDETTTLPESPNGAETPENEPAPVKQFAHQQTSQPGRHLIDPQAGSQEEPATADPNLMMEVPVIAAQTLPLLLGLKMRTDGVEFGEGITPEAVPYEPIRSSGEVHHLKLKPATQYHGVRNSLNQGLAALIEPIKNTHIKVRRMQDHKDPGFRIEVMTDQYYAVAMVHLLPKNNR